MVSLTIRRAVLVEYVLAIVVSFSSWIAGAWLSWPSSAVKKLLKGEVCCKATNSEVATMVALMDFGNIISPIPSSYLSDKYGRKILIHSTALLYLIGSICVMSANNMGYLYAARTIAGMSKGITFAVVPLYLAEIAEVKIRGALGTIFAHAGILGMTYDFTLGAFISYQNLNIANLVVTLVFGIGMFFIPESPYYLVMKGKVKKAQKSLAIFRQAVTKDELLNAEMEVIEETVENEMKNKARFIDVAATKSRRRALKIVLFTAAAQRLSGISPLLAYSTITLPESGGGASREVYVMIMSYLMMVAVYVSQYLVDSWGRKKLMLLSTFGCAVLNAVFAIFYTLRSRQVDVSHFNWIPYTNVLLFGFLWALGLMCIPSILVGELFPTNVKSYASSLAAITYAVVSFAINKLFVEVSSLFGVEVMFYFFSIACVLCGVFFIDILFETKGKTFQEIQSILREITGE